MRLRYFDITSVVFIGMLFYAGITEATGQDAITSLASDASHASHIEYTETQNKFIIKVDNNGCECIKNDCGCCQRLVWDTVSIDGILCTNVTYLKNDYGISLTVTYNNFSIFNETVSARNPPPICFGQDIIDPVDVEVCLRIYDINYKAHKFHACFEISGKIMKLPVTRIKLGCIQTKMQKEMEYIENSLSPLFSKRIKEDMLPNVIMV